MSKEWKCVDCCHFGTDACHFPSMKEHYIACEHLVVDHDKAYQQGRADAIDEFAKLIHKDLYQLNHHQVDFIAEQLKEQKNE